MKKQVRYHKNPASVTVWDCINKEWIRIYSLSSEASRLIPYEELENIKKYFADHSWENKGTGNESNTIKYVAKSQINDWKPWKPWENISKNFIKINLFR